MLSTEVIAPSPPLGEFVRHYVCLRASTPGSPQVRPIAARNELILAFNLDERHEAYEYRTAAPRLLPSALLVGPQTARRADLWLGERWVSFAVHFRPSAFLRLFHLPVSDFTDRALDAGDIIGSEAATLRDRLAQAGSAVAMARLVDRYLRQRVAAAAPMHPTARAAEAMISRHGRMTVGEAVRTTGLSPRHFERRFVEQMGMAPKLYGRVARLNFVLRLKTRQPALTWAQISQEAGFFDQTHVVKDFKAMAGAPPGAYMRSGLPADGGFLLSSPQLHA